MYSTGGLYGKFYRTQTISMLLNKNTDEYYDIPETKRVIKLIMLTRCPKEF